MNHEELARAYFRQGYNCAQAITLAFSDLIGIDELQMVRLSSSFGGGIGGLRETCGAVSGMLIVAGLLFGYDRPNDLSVKSTHYARIKALAQAFIEKNQTMNCRELLHQAGCDAAPAPSERTEEYYARRPCERLVGEAAALLDEYIAAHPDEQNS